MPKNSMMRLMDDLQVVTNIVQAVTTFLHGGDDLVIGLAFDRICQILGVKHCFQDGFIYQTAIFRNVCLSRRFYLS